MAIDAEAEEEEEDDDDDEEEDEDDEDEEGSVDEDPSLPVSGDGTLRCGLCF
eukprot:gene8884-5101_t